jgi:N5-(cytidine 5'-diphosphoramidyl)-L-glutamine hydrolase
MRIALTQRLMTSPSQFEEGFGIESNWPFFLRNLSHDLLIFQVPNDVGSLAGWLKVVGPDAVILTGGEDVGKYPDRDALELSILDLLYGTVPILGICRGFQIINLWSGGTQSVATNDDHLAVSHPVNIEDLSLREWLNSSELVVNSYHSNLVRPHELSEQMTVVATAPDGSVESFRSTDRSVLAFQWHPERPREYHKLMSSYIHRFIHGRGS